MLKEDRRFAYAAVIAAAVLAVGVLVNAVSSFENPRQSLNASNEKQSGNSPNARSFLERAINDPVAVATFLLVIVGALSLVQIRYLIRADRTARTSAEAAKKAADALPNVERAYVYLRITHNLFGIQNIMTVTERGKATPTQYRNGFYCDYEIVNYGKTPAIIDEVRVGAAIVEGPLDPLAWADRPKKFTSQRVLAPGTPIALRLDDVRQISMEDGDKILAGSAVVYFFGIISYEDIFGDDHETQFCFRQSRDRFEQWGGQAHNRRT